MQLGRGDRPTCPSSHLASFQCRQAKRKKNKRKAWGVFKHYTTHACMHHTFSVNRELLLPSAECRLRPSAAGRRAMSLGWEKGLGDMGGLRVRLASSKGLSVGCVMTGVRAGLGRTFMRLGVSPVSLLKLEGTAAAPNSLGLWPPYSLFMPRPP